jgi:hypothetical protein
MSKNKNASKIAASTVANVETIETPTQDVSRETQETVELPASDEQLPVEEGTIDNTVPQDTFILPTKLEGETDLAYAQRIAKLLPKKSSSSNVPKGEYKPKLSQDVAMIIYDEVVNKKVKQSVFAVKYGVHTSTISDIKAGRLYPKVKAHYDALSTPQEGQAAPESGTSVDTIMQDVEASHEG